LSYFLIYGIHFQHFSEIQRFFARIERVSKKAVNTNFRFKNILVGVDGQDGGLHALGEAIRLAQWSKGKVTAVTVSPFYEGDLSLVGVHHIRELVVGPCETIRSQALALAGSMDAQIAVECHGGNPDEVIPELASSKGCDLLVLGGRKRGPVLGLLQGRLTAAIIGNSSIAVLVVPLYCNLGWQKLLLLNAANRCTQDALGWSAALSATYGGQLTVLELTPRAGRSVTAASVRERVACDQIDMILVSRAPKGRLALRKRYLLSSLINHSPCPVLILAPSFDPAV
jgi:nucleotide-binding universal stress UspA family protein